jgi:geranylgeranyl pyrophosphate synthase
MDLPCEREVDLVRDRLLETRPEVPGIPDEWMCEFLTDGKFVRSRLLFLSYYAAGGQVVEDDVVDASASIELIHCASLVHDDILDDAETRRGLLSAPVLLGEPVSILLGDALFTEAFYLGSNLGPEIAQLTRQGVRDMISGEAREMVHDAPDWEPEEAERVARDKTASLLGTACATGGELAEADPDTVDRLQRFGIEIGVAFQAVDDVLDVSGDDETGKPMGIDARVGAPNLARALGGEGAQEAREIALERVQRAYELLDPIPDTEGKQRLFELAEFVGTRER